jgi:hypothetical protein
LILILKIPTAALFLIASNTPKIKLEPTVDFFPAKVT